ncbi:MAG: hypothetical protein JNK60_06430 [Acidobacteria bacterium]|nr:hypothetical protein [Acidobacteriota bacterium]
MRTRTPLSSFSALAVLAALGLAGCGKGRDGAPSPAPATASAPAAVDPALVEGEFTVLDAPASVPAGSTFTLRVEVRNTTSFPWPSAGATPVRLGYHWADPEGNKGSWESVVWDDGRRGALTADLAPGEKTVVTLEVLALSAPTKGARLVIAPFVANLSTSGWHVGKVHVQPFVIDSVPPAAAR